MPTFRYNEDEQGNKKFILQIDPETDQQMVSCGCCPCDGCGTIGKNLDGATTISISASFELNVYYLNPIEGSAQGVEPTDSCFAGVGTTVSDDSGNTVEFFSSISISKNLNTGECSVLVSASAGGSIGEFCVAFTTVPINQMLGTFTVTGGYGGAESSSPCSAGVTSFTATITIS
jgi:hypothetical protein